MADRKRSKVWLHFNKCSDNGDYARCNLCGMKYKATGGNTSNLRKHLVKHKIFLKAEECTIFARPTRTDVTSAPSPASDTGETGSAAGGDNSDNDSSEASSSSSAAGPAVRVKAAMVTPFTKAKETAFTRQRTDECHRAVTAFVVKGMLPFTTVDSSWFREMTRALNPKYTPPNRQDLCNTLIPAWYNVEKVNVKQELKAVDHVAVTADAWSSVAQDHYITVTVHYAVDAELREKVLHTRAVYVSQTGSAVAEEIDSILDEFEVKSKVVAVTVDNAANMDVAVQKMKVMKMGCFAHTLNIAAQKLYSLTSIANWSGRIRAVVLWLRINSLAKPVLKEKQKLLGLDEHSLILDVRTRWNSLFLMVERFIEQYPAIQAASRDPRIKKAMDRDRLLRVSDDDMSKCEDFVDTMRVLYTSTLAVSADRSATAGQILPILDKLRAKFEVKDEDSAFKKAIKEKVWADLSHRYTEETNKELRLFLEEATALDPRFKGKIQDEAVWTRLENEAVVLFTGDKIGEVTQQEGEEVAEGEEMPEAPEKRKKKLSALGELFQDEDQEVLFQREIDTQAPSLAEKAKNELLIYQRFPAVLSSVHPLLWWWQKRDQMPMLASLAKKYLCVQASSTPSERVFSTAGDTVSVERARLLPEKVDMLVFLKKNG